MAASLQRWLQDANGDCDEAGSMALQLRDDDWPWQRWARSSNATFLAEPSSLACLCFSHLGA